MLQIRDRAAWREALLNKSYDQQCDRLSWGGSSKNNVSRLLHYVGQCQNVVNLTN